MLNPLLRSLMICALCLAAQSIHAGTVATLPPENEREVMVRSLTQWDLSCSGASRGPWKNMAGSWYNEIVNDQAPPLGHGGEGWFGDGFYHQEWLTFEGPLLKINTIVDSDFADKNLVSWGKDHQHDKLDEVDAAMITTHGTSGGSDGSWVGTMRIDEAGGGNCNAYQGDMALGGDLEFLHLSSCASMDEGDWHPDWSSSFQGVHQIDGFHGVMWIWNNQDWFDRYRDFADDSFSIPIALAWLDNHYDYKCSIESQDPITLARKDQCPVARGAGFGQADALNRLYTERYDNVLDDPVNPTWHHVLYYAGCDPVSGDPLADLETECDPFAKSGGAPPTSIPPGQTRAGLGDYLAQVDSALPSFDATILAAGNGPDWMSALTLFGVADAVADTPVTTIVTEDGKSEAIDPTGVRVYKMDTGRGRVRYANLDRQFSLDTSPPAGWDPTRAASLVFAAMSALSIPTTEYDIATSGRVNTILGTSFDGADPSGTPFSTYESERVVTVRRTVNALPVPESMVRASVSNTGSISRMLVRWPQFMMPAGLQLRDRSDVVAEIAQQIADDQFGEPVSLYIYLAYGRVGTSYLPVAVAEYEDQISGAIFMAPLVGVSSDVDLDGIHDVTDNCLDVPNTAQRDQDHDAVGDLCDNCPKQANPDQQDSDQDGTGDACDIAQGACVFTDGSCDDVTRDQCTDGEGTPQGDGTRCAAIGSVDVTMDAQRLSWTAAPVAAGYDVVRGDLRALRAGGGDFATATLGCVADNQPTTAVGFALNPPMGAGWTFLVRPVFGVGNGSYDSAGSGQPDSRDAETAASGLDCP